MSAKEPDMDADEMELLSEISLFAELDEAGRAVVAAACQVVLLPANALLFAQGDPGDSLYVIKRGRLGVRMQLPDGAQADLDELEPGVSVGEMSLLTGQPRVATVYALEDSVLLRLSRASFEQLGGSHPDLVRRISEASVPRLLRTQLADALSALFGPLEQAALHELQAAVEWCHLGPGELLFRAGEPGDALYLVVNGRLRATASDSSGRQRLLGEIGRGECVGELALLSGEPRMATVCAVRESDVVRLSQELFARLLEQHPRAMLQIARLVARRAQPTLGRPVPSPAATFALVPAGPDVPLAAMAAALADALASLAPTLLLDAERLDTALGRPGTAQTPPAAPTNIALSGWLSQRAASYRYVVYLADPHWSEWTRRCLRQADLVLIVGRAGDDPTPGQIEQAMAEMGVQARTDLLLIHPDDTAQPSGTRAWLEPRTLFTHHHARLGRVDDLRRLARRLTGRATGLVLGGGGARGFVHIGAIRALDEAGIDIDMIAGTSIGALIGAAYARGQSWQELAAIAARFSSRKQLIDLTLPLVSFAAGRKVSRFYRHHFGDEQIEDLWRPFFCISSNLSNATPERHERGPLWAAIRASSAIPGIFAPVQHENGDVLVDGGVMNNFPLDVMREVYEAGVVIGVSAAPSHDKSRNYRFGESVSGWRVLAGRLGLAKKVRVPSLFGSMLRTIEINSVYITRSPAFRQLADLIIQPPVEQFRVLDFDAHATIIEVGYQAAREQIAAWQNASAAQHTPDRALSDTA
jgi:NTE family protein/lysophospholipid hydrolase